MKLQIDARTLDRGEGQVAYELAGHGLVVCLPGLGELRSSYRYNVASLAEAGFRVAAMDLRGHGGSDVTFTAYDDVATATDAIALIEQLGGPGSPLALARDRGTARPVRSRRRARSRALSTVPPVERPSRPPSGVRSAMGAPAGCGPAAPRARHRQAARERRRPPAGGSVIDMPRRCERRTMDP